MRRRVEDLSTIAPLVDCVFLLLVFFLLTSTYMERGAIEVQLPRSRYSAAGEAEAMTVTLAASGAVYVGGRRLALEDISENVRGEKKVLVRADARVPLSLLVKVLDELKEAGVEDMDLRTLPEEE